MMVYTGILTLLGMKFLMREIERELHTITKVVPRLIAMEFATLLVTARVEQIPSAILKVGLSLIIPLVKIVKDESFLSAKIEPHDSFNKRFRFFVDNVFHELAG